MRLGSQIQSWMRAVMGRARMESDMDTELRFHMETYADDLQRQGVAHEEALRRARIEFGGVERAKEECREARGISFLETLLQDLRYGMRALAKSPCFTAIAVLTLALGIGANTAIFNVVNATLLQPLPIREGSRLVVIWISNLEHGWSRIGPAGQDYLDWQEQSKSFDDLFMFEHGTGTVTAPGEPEQVAGLRVTTNFGDFFGIKPVVGRTFRLEEGAGRHNYAVLGYGYWQRKFAGDPSVLGRGMTLNGEEYTIIGVLPPDFAALFPADLVVPFDTDWIKRADSDLGVFGRLKPAGTLKEASGEMSVIAGRIANARPSRKGFGVVLVPLQDARLEYLRPALLVLLGAVGFVLLISCANVGNLMLARSIARQTRNRDSDGAGGRTLETDPPVPDGEHHPGAIGRRCWGAPGAVVNALTGDFCAVSDSRSECRRQSDAAGNSHDWQSVCLHHRRFAADRDHLWIGSSVAKPALQCQRNVERRRAGICLQPARKPHAFDSGDCGIRTGLCAGDWRRADDQQASGTYCKPIPDFVPTIC